MEIALLSGMQGLPLEARANKPFIQKVWNAKRAVVARIRNTGRSTDEIDPPGRGHFSKSRRWSQNIIRASRSSFDHGQTPQWRGHPQKKEPFDAELLVLFGLPTLIILIPWAIKDPAALAIIPLLLIIPGVRDIILGVLKDMNIGMKRASKFMNRQQHRMNRNKSSWVYPSNPSSTKTRPHKDMHRHTQPSPEIIYDLDKDEFIIENNKTNTEEIPTHADPTSMVDGHSHGTVALVTDRQDDVSFSHIDDRFSRQGHGKQEKYHKEILSSRNLDDNAVADRKKMSFDEAAPSIPSPLIVGYTDDASTYDDVFILPSRQRRRQRVSEASSSFYGRELDASEFRTWISNSGSFPNTPSVARRNRMRKRQSSTVDVAAPRTASTGGAGSSRRHTSPDYTPGAANAASVHSKQTGKRRNIPWYARPMVMVLPFLKDWGGFM